MLRAGDIVKTKSWEGEYFYSFVISNQGKLYLNPANIFHILLYHLGVRNVIWRSGHVETVVSTESLNRKKLAIVKDDYERQR